MTTGLTAQLSLLDAAPELLATPEKACTAIVYGHEGNVNFGHLLIAALCGDWLFLNMGGPFIRCCLPGWDTAVDLDADQLEVLGEYCLRQARRLRARHQRGTENT